jgi:hypothetical protein
VQIIGGTAHNYYSYSHVTLNSHTDGAPLDRMIAGNHNRALWAQGVQPTPVAEDCEARALLGRPVSQAAQEAVWSACCAACVLLPTSVTTKSPPARWHCPECCERSKGGGGQGGPGGPCTRDAAGHVLCQGQVERKGCTCSTPAAGRGDEPAKLLTRGGTLNVCCTARYLITVG